jgi:pimeloyl-ACP methyl ester carboxylesterase
VPGAADERARIAAMRIDNDGVGLEVVVDGPEGGPPVLFLHGISGSSATYDFLVPRYPRHRIHRLDFRGHGRSDRAPGHYVMDDFASDAEAVLAAVGPMPIVGHSLGGITAAFVSQRHPELARALFMEDPPLYFGDREVFDGTAFAVVFPLLQAAIKSWQAEGASAEQIAAAMAAAPSMSGQGTMGDESTADALAATGMALTQLDPSVFDPVLSGASLGQFDPEVPIPAPGVLLQPDRELGAAFFDDHATRLGALNPRLEVVRLRGVGHLIHDSLTHRDEYLTQLDRFLATYAPA